MTEVVKIRPKVIYAGVAATIIAAGLWAFTVILTEYEIGYAAIGIGVLVGYAVRYASGLKYGRSLQITASVLSFIGVLSGKYITFSYFLAQELSLYPEYFGVTFYDVLISPYTILVMFEDFTCYFTFFDLFWILLAVHVAWTLNAVPKKEEEFRKTFSENRHPTS